MESIYNEIYELCKVRDTYERFEFSERGKFIEDLLNRYEIKFERLTTQLAFKLINNFFIPGDSKKFLCAHYDVANINSDNANDNSASIINALAAKLENPELNVWITDFEEYGGWGAEMACLFMQKEKFEVDWILNLELTGYGREAMIDPPHNVLTDKLIEVFNAIERPVPFNDSMIFREFGFNSKVITLLPEKGYTRHLMDCHTNADSVDKVNLDDMKEFVRKIGILTNL